MRLKTEMVMGEACALGKTATERKAKYKHDAMAARALLQALRNEAPGVHARVIERADEILAGWMVEE